MEATLKKIIGWQKTQAEKNAIVEHNFVEKYRKNISFSKAKKSDIITVSVTHISLTKLLVMQIR